LQRRISELPGVTRVSYSADALLDGGSSSRTVHGEGRADKNKVEVQTLRVGPNYFETMKIPLLEGRLLNQTDTGTTAHALVNRALVQKFVSGRNPLGLHFRGDLPEDPQWEIAPCNLIRRHRWVQVTDQLCMPLSD
jgi:hypothetical protein